MEWDKTRFLVTGGAGFLGSFVMEQLRAKGAVNIFAPTINEVDLTDTQSVRRLMGEVKPEVIIHLAARVAGIGANQKYPAEFFYENMMMGTNIIHEAWKAGAKKVVAIGTVCSYPKEPKTIPFKEDEIWDGYPEETNAAYGLSKKMLIVQAQAYRQQYGFNTVVLLPVNLYGPRDNFNLETSHVIPAFIIKCLAAKESGSPEVVMWGDGSPTREFLYIEDAARGILMAVERYDDSLPANLGSGQEIRIKDLVNKLAGILEYTGKITWDTSKPNGQPRRLLDVTRAKEKFGFSAEISFDEGLRRTVDWYLSARAARKGG
ncbi:MAG: GDP-L-fucose synthase [Anaerolineales bacterium]|nr:GDP-L-fucose synthase [Anaerolineales bacterium]